MATLSIIYPFVFANFIVSIKVIIESIKDIVPRKIMEKFSVVEMMDGVIIPAINQAEAMVFKNIVSWVFSGEALFFRLGIS